MYLYDSKQINYLTYLVKIENMLRNLGQTLNKQTCGNAFKKEKINYFNKPIDQYAPHMRCNLFLHFHVIL